MKLTPRQLRALEVLAQPEFTAYVMDRIRPVPYFATDGHGHGEQIYARTLWSLQDRGLVESNQAVFRAGLVITDIGRDALEAARSRP